MFYVNKIVGLFLSPSGVGCGLIALGLALKVAGLAAGALSPERRRSVFKFAWLLVAVGYLWLLAWSMPAVGKGVIRLFDWYSYKVVADGKLPTADAIVVLGGGSCGERACTGVRLWRQGKAPVVITSGLGSAGSDATMLRDMGVDGSAIVVEPKARNTEENARYEARLVTKAGGGRPKVLLVTSWYHMRRSLMIHRKIAPDVEWIPVVTKYGIPHDTPLTAGDFKPSLSALHEAEAVVHEIVGVLGYKMRGF